MIKGIKATIREFPGVLGVYDLIVNEYGKNEANASVHIQVPDDMDAKTLHSLSKKISAAIYLKYHIALTIGVYANNDSDPKAMEIKNALMNLLKEEKEILQMHGFYLEEEQKLVTFDLIFTYEEKNAQARCDEIQKKMEALFPDYQFYVVLDRDYTD